MMARCPRMVSLPARMRTGSSSDPNLATRSYVHWPIRAASPGNHTQRARPILTTCWRTCLLRPLICAPCPCRSPTHKESVHSYGTGNLPDERDEPEADVLRILGVSA